MPYTYEYPRPALTVDCVVFRVDAEGLKLLLIERGLPPFLGQWALPGGFVRMDETTEEAARRELAEEAGMREVYLEQLCTFSAVDRDPRERVVSVAYYALVHPQHAVVAGDDAADARWFDARRHGKLAFDHDLIVKTALERLVARVRYQPIGFELLPKKFTLGALQRLYEHILGRPLDKRNFRRTMLGMQVLDELDERQAGVSPRPPRLYRFNRAAYRRLTREGMHFEV